MKKLGIAVLALAAVLSASAVDFPGPNPGVAMAQVDGAVYTLSNAAIMVSFRVSGGQLLVDSIEDKEAGQVYAQSVVSPIFKMKTSGAGLLSDWVITSGPTLADAVVNTNSASNGQHVPGKIIAASFASATGGVTLDWFAELRDGSGYLRSVVEFAGDGTTAESFTEIELLCDLEIDPAGARQIGDVKDAVYNQDRDGEVVRSANMFFGVEMPFYWNDLSNHRIRGGLTSTLSLGPGNRYSFSAVMGVYPDGQLRRAFLHYNNRERARSYKPFLHYNCWYDLPMGLLNETDLLDRIDTIHDELTVQRGVELHSYVADDGYDDYSAATGGFWQYDGTKFPNGFTPLASRLQQIESHLGIWISPGGGYSGETERFARAVEDLGPSITAWDLSIPAYFNWWNARHVGHVQNDRANYFKWDKLGSSASGHFMKLMEVARTLRGINPELFVNTTVGTWQSPFWLNQIDCTWRGEADVGWEGEGDERERWNTYRDRSSWDRMNEAGGIYPLNALMNHGIVFGTQLQAATVALGKTDIRHEVRSYFGGGYALQELYLAPPTLGASQWDAIAEGALWAKNKTDILVDAHFIGPSPAQNKVYGFAAWQNDEGTITLRNPSSATKSFELDVGTAFELPEGAARAYVLQSPYADQRIQTLNAVAGRMVSIELQPYEVLVFDAAPDMDNIYAVLAVSEPKGIAPQTLRFDVSASIDSSRIARYELDCDGDGAIDSTGSGLSMFTFTNAGTYTAELTVFDATNGFDVIAKTIAISETNAVLQNTYLSDLNWVSQSVGFGGTVRKDASIDDNPITLNGTVYAKGLGAHAQSEIVYNLAGNYMAFRSVIGVDDEILDDNPHGEIVFKVYGDDLLLYESALLGPTDAPIVLDIDVTGVQTLKLVAEQGVNNFGDHADWADALIVPVPAANQPVYLSDLPWVSDSVGFGSGTQRDTSTDGNPITLNGTVYAKGLGTHAQSETILDLVGGYTTFHSVIGVDDEILDDNPYAQISFKVYGDNVLLFNSGTQGPTSDPVAIDIDVTDVQTLKLVTEEGANNWGDHADWADAYVMPVNVGFGAWAATHGVSADPEANDDPDKLNNFTEYCFELDPAIDDADGAMTFAVDGSGTVQYRFLATVGNVNFTVEYSTDLATWAPYNGELTLAGTHYQVNVPDSLASPDGTLFLRLRLSE